MFTTMPGIGGQLLREGGRLVARAAPRAALTASIKPEFRAPIGAPAPNPSYAAHTHKSWGGNSFTAVKIIMIIPYKRGFAFCN